MTVVERLRAGVETGPFFNRRALPIYALAIAQILIAFIAFRLCGFRLAPGMSLGVPLWALSLIPASWALRRIRHERAAGTIETIALVCLQGVASYTILLCLTTIAAPDADRLLSSVDLAFGFSWPEFAADVQPFASVLHSLYATFPWQPFGILPLLFLFRKEQRAWSFVAALAVGLILTAAIYPFAPAQGAVAHFGATNYPGIGPEAWNFGIAIHLVRDEHVRVVSSTLVAGLVSFPSYHAAAALIYGWAAWPLPGIRWFFVVLNLGMAISAIICGGHYLVDILGGAAVGTASVWLACMLSKRGLAP